MAQTGHNMNVGIVALLVVAIAEIAQAGNDRMLAPLKGNPKFDQIFMTSGSGNARAGKPGR